ncbi:MAG: glycosyltransferase [Chromatiales bacterium]|nr:glycosyltransferase [Chromatiales bacterium]
MNSDGHGKRIFWLSDANAAHTLRWARALSAAGYKVLVYSLAAPQSPHEWASVDVRLETAGIDPGVAYSADGGLRKLSYIGTLPKVKSLARVFDPHIVHAHYVSSYGVLATIAGLRPRVISAWGADVYTTPSVTPLHKAAIGYVLRNANRILSTSHTMRTKVLELVSNGNVHVVPFGIDLERFSPVEKDGGGRRPITIGTIKSLETKYGMEFLMRAFARICAGRPQTPMRLVIVGGGALRRDLEVLSVELGIDRTTTFVGRVDNDVVHRYHQELDVAVYPSIDHSESFGVSVVESQACGIPVVVSNVGGLPEVVESGVTGLVVPPGDVRALALAIETLIDNTDLRNRFGEAGRRRVEQEYSLPACVRLLSENYSAVLDGR